MPHEHGRTAVLISVWTGVRIGELAELRAMSAGPISAWTFAAAMARTGSRLPDAAT